MFNLFGPDFSFLLNSDKVKGRVRRGFLMNRRLIFFIILLMLGSTACGEKEKGEPVQIPSVSGVRVETVTVTPVEKVYEAVGTVRSRTTVVLSSRIVGSILAVYVREGDRVRAGQRLIEIDERGALAQLQKAQGGFQEARDSLAEAEGNIQAAQSAKEAAEANKKLATSTYNRYKALFEKRSVSLQEFDQVEARYQTSLAEANRAGELLQSVLARKEQVRARIKQAQAEVESARVSLGYARISSPLDGIVTSKQAEVGALAAPGLPLLTVEDNLRYRLEAVVEESRVRRIRVGEPVKVRIEAVGLEWPGKVTEIVPETDPHTRSSIVKIDLPQKAGPSGNILRSGLYGKAFFPTGKENAIAIPQKAVIERGELEQVYVVDSENIAHLRLIKTGKAYGDRVEVLAGIREGERIVVEGVEKVKDRSRVEEKRS
jgi:multidrug efflux pump subunit AcrA (membrane-fusion protein)